LRILEASLRSCSEGGARRRSCGDSAGPCAAAAGIVGGGVAGGGALVVVGAHAGAAAAAAAWRAWRRGGGHLRRRRGGGGGARPGPASGAVAETPAAAGTAQRAVPVTGGGRGAGTARGARWAVAHALYRASAATESALGMDFKPTVFTAMTR